MSKFLPRPSFVGFSVLGFLLLEFLRATRVPEMLSLSPSLGDAALLNRLVLVIVRTPYAVVVVSNSTFSFFFLHTVLSNSKPLRRFFFSSFFFLYRVVLPIFKVSLSQKKLPNKEKAAAVVV